MQRVFRRLIPPAFCAVVVGLASAQSTSPEGSNLTIRAGTQEVVLDLIVRDNRGRFVNLRPDEVEIYEDGVRQQIKSFRQVSGREVVQESGVKDSKTAAPGVALTNALPTPNLIAIVMHGLDPYTKKYAVEAAQEFLRNNFQPNTWVAAFSLDSGLTPLHEFTTDRAELIKAAANAFTGPSIDFTSVASAVLNASPNIATIEETVNGNPATGGTVSTALVVTGGEVNPRAINGADLSSDAGANRMRGDLASQRRQFGSIEGMRQLDQLSLLIDQLAKLPGRKTVLLLSTGLMNTEDPDRFERVVKKANAAEITFYAVDVNGLSENSNALAGSTALGHAASVSSTQSKNTSNAQQNMEKMRQDDYVVQAVRTTDSQATLRTLSEDTGGFLIGNTNDLRKPYQHLIEDLDAHYEAVYHPTSDKYDGHLRSIQVKLTRPDWTVESRTGYYAMPALGAASDLKPYDMMGLAALNVKTPPHAFPFKSAALEFRPTAAGSEEAIVFEMPAADLTATAEPATKRHRIHVSVLQLVTDENGEVVDKFSQDSPYEIPDENLAAAQKSTLTFSHAIDLPPGKYTAETAATDREDDHASISKVSFEVPPRKGVGLSSITLVQRLEPVTGKPDTSDPFQFDAGQGQGKHVIPELASSLRSDAKPYAYFVIYPEKSSAEKPKLQVEFLVNNQVLAKQVADLPPPDASGRIPMVVGAAAKSGDCELRITALQGESSATQSLKYQVAAGQ